MGTPILPLLKTVLGSIIQVFLIALAGYVLARKDILDKRTQKQLNRINVALFTPCLLFSKVAFSLSPEKLKELWIIPIFFVLLSVVSLVAAWLMAHLFHLKTSQRHFAMAAAMFMNSNSLPIALLQSLVVAVPGLRWGDDDSESAMVGRALSYLTVCSTLGMVLRWSYGVRLLAAADPISEFEPEQVNSENEDQEERHSEVYNERTPLLSSSPNPNPQALLLPEMPTISIHGPTSPTRESPPVFYSFPNTPTASRENLPTETPSATTSIITVYQSDSEPDTDEELPTPLVRRRHRSPPFSLRKARLRVRAFVKPVAKFMTPPLYAALISIVVAMVPALQHTLDVHLTPLRGAVNEAGNCCIPVTLVVLGAYFYHPPSPDDNNDKTNGTADRGRIARRESWWARSTSSLRSVFSLKTLREGRAGEESDKVKTGETRTVFVAVAARMIVVPALFLPLMMWGALIDNPKIFEDPVFILSLVLLLSSPPALTLAQMTQAVSGDAFERLISRTIFWSYCIVTPPATVAYAVIAMIIAKM